MGLAFGKSVSSFFLRNLKNLESISPIFSPELQKYAVQEKFNEVKSTLRQSAVQRGTKWYTKLLIGIMTWYTDFLRKAWEKRCSSSASGNITTNSKKTLLKFVRKNRRKKRNKNRKDWIKNTCFLKPKYLYLLWFIIHNNFY